MMNEHVQVGRFARLRDTLASALLRDPAVVLLDRDGGDAVTSDEDDEPHVMGSEFS